MKDKKIKIVWRITLLILLIIAILMIGINNSDIELPDKLIRVLGIIGLIALPIYAFTTVKKYLHSKK